SHSGLIGLATLRPRFGERKTLQMTRERTVGKLYDEVLAQDGEIFEVLPQRRGAHIFAAACDNRPQRVPIAVHDAAPQIAGNVLVHDAVLYERSEGLKEIRNRAHRLKLRGKERGEQRFAHRRIVVTLGELADEIL